MFESLQEGLRRAFKTMTGTGKFTESNMRQGLDLVRDALLEADVNYEVVKTFLAKVSEQALGDKVLTSLKPTEQLLAIVRTEMVRLMGPVEPGIPLRSDLTVLMMCGLQGSGKTTTCGKLAKLLLDKAEGIKPLLAGADLQRPAAMEQLRILGEQVGVPVYIEPGSKNAVAVCQNAIKHAKQIGANVVILDTAGRLHIDDELMRELKEVDQRVGPHQIYLVVDAATGQDAVNSAKAFNEALDLNGVIMTKLDGDTRGGATLSVKQVTGVPVKFIGTGEHLIDLEVFDPERMATRILGGGDLGSLIEMASRVMDKDTQEELQARMMQGQFTLDDFRKQIDQFSKLGSMGKILDLIPGMGQIKEMMGQVDGDREMKKLKGIIDSMTPAERRNPRATIDTSRRRRIAAGAGVEPHQVNELVKSFEGMAGMMTNMAKLGVRDRFKAVQQMASGGLLNPGAALQKAKGNTGKRLTPEERKRQQKQRERELKKLKWDKKNPGTN